MNELKDKEQKKKLNVQEYRRFIEQIGITDVRIISAQINVIDHAYFPSSAQVNWKMSASYEQIEGRFSISHRYNVTIKDKKINEIKAKIQVTFLVTYSSKIPINDDLFKIFKTHNLQVNTWPYFREFVHNSIIRMGWPSFIAPVFTI